MRNCPNDTNHTSTKCIDKINDQETAQSNGLVLCCNCMSSSPASRETDHSKTLRGPPFSLRLEQVTQQRYSLASCMSSEPFSSAKAAVSPTWNTLCDLLRVLIGGQLGEPSDAPIFCVLLEWTDGEPGALSLTRQRTNSPSRFLLVPGGKKCPHNSVRLHNCSWPRQIVAARRATESADERLCCTGAHRYDE